MSEAPDRNLALELVRATEAAALAAARWVGRGQKEEGDGAAVDALRLLLGTVRMNGIVVIGEGEKDEAPMLYNGEVVGNGSGPLVDVAVDPVEGTNLLAKGLPNSISVVAIAPRGALFDLSLIHIWASPPGRSWCWSSAPSCCSRCCLGRRAGWSGRGLSLIHI